MFKKTMLASVFFGLFCYLSASNAENPTVFSTSDKPIVVTADHPYFTLRLQANPTTGFFWYLTDYDHFLLIPISEKYQAGNTKLVGAPGVEAWEFHVPDAGFQVPHLLKIKLTHARPWETKGVSIQEFTVITRR